MQFFILPFAEIDGENWSSNLRNLPVRNERTLSWVTDCLEAGRSFSETTYQLDKIINLWVRSSQVERSEWVGSKAYSRLSKVQALPASSHPIHPNYSRVSSSTRSLCSSGGESIKFFASDVSRQTRKLANQLSNTRTSQPRSGSLKIIGRIIVVR